MGHESPAPAMTRHAGERGRLLSSLALRVRTSGPRRVAHRFRTEAHSAVEFQVVARREATAPGRTSDGTMRRAMRGWRIRRCTTQFRQ